MTIYRSIEPPVDLSYLKVEDTYDISIPEGEPLYDTIQRAILQDAPITADVTPVYDESDSDSVDPYCNIRTDFFSLAEQDAKLHENYHASLAIQAKADSIPIIPASSEAPAVEAGKDEPALAGE